MRVLGDLVLGVIIGVVFGMLLCSMSAFADEEGTCQAQEREIARLRAENAGFRAILRDRGCLPKRKPAP